MAVTWKQYVDHDLTGKAFRFLPAKADRTNTVALVPVMPELQDFLAALKVRTKDGPIALRDNGKIWEDEVEMQTRVSHWLRDRERDGLIGAGTTLHGLRSTYAAWLSRNAANTKEVTATLGDKPERTGIHYTRHVEAEANVGSCIRADQEQTRQEREQNMICLMQGFEVSNLENPLLGNRQFSMQINEADVAELVDARDLKSLDGNVVWVRVPPPAPRDALGA